MKAHTFQWPQELEGYSTKILAHNNKMCDHVRERACSALETRKDCVRRKEGKTTEQISNKRQT